jgi:hypothetical protein
MFGKRLLALLAVILIAVGTYAALAQSQPSSIRMEVAEDGNRFVFGQERLHEDGLPAYGTPFVTQGYIYPEGTLNGSNGVLPNGEPEFPDRVIGTWTCYGYMIGDGAHTTTGPWVVSTQVYAFENGTVITDGFEIADLNTSVSRAITGGTGEFVNASGQQAQELLGFTEQMGVNLRVELQLAQ